MNVEKLRKALGGGLFGGDTDEVVVQLDQPSVAVVAHTGIESATKGFDWEAGMMLLQPSTPLVSWEYLEKVHPGIREEIEQDRKNYNRRPIRCIVAGSRNIGFSDDERASIKHALEQLVCLPYTTTDKIEVVSGCAAGVDSEAARIAMELGYAVKEFPADWDLHGKAAGSIRNRQMADYAAENDSLYRGILIAFWDGESPGTKNMIDTALKLGLEMRVFKKDKDAAKFERIPYA